MLLLLALLAAAPPPPPIAIPWPPIEVTAKALEGLPEASASFSHHGEKHDCIGRDLRALLVKVGAVRDEPLRGTDLSGIVRVTARDGYTVAFSLGELDPTLGNRRVLIAEACDGNPLGAEEGPYRLVMPGDERPARSVRQLRFLQVQ